MKGPRFTALAALLLLAAAGPRKDGTPISRQVRRVFRDVIESPAPSEPPNPEAVALRADLERRARELRPLIERLETLQHGYPLLKDLGQVEPERSELRRKLIDSSAAFTEGYERFDVLWKTNQAIELQRILTGGAVGEVNSRISTAMELDHAHKEFKDLKKQIKVLLWYEDVDYQKAAAEILARRRHVRLQAGGAAAAAGVLLLAVWMWRRQGGAAPTLRLGAPFGPAGAVARGAVVGGNFRIEREIGRGGMGLVYEALDLSLQRKVAVKQMRSELRESPKDFEAFLAEARLVASLKHPNIVEIHSIVNAGGELFLVFEFVNGSPLHSMLQRVPRVPLNTARGLLHQVGSALDYAHGQKVIHRDLKPANIMLTPQGAVKVMDFGLAHQVQQTVARQTRAESWGTPPYMAPEQEMGTVSRESDLYSVGVCLYEMLTGKLPFPGPNYLMQKREMHFVLPSRAAPGVAAGADAVLARALHVDPGQRYHSAAELLEALDALEA